MDTNLFDDNLIVLYFHIGVEHSLKLGLDRTLTVFMRQESSLDNAFSDSPLLCHMAHLQEIHF